MSCLEPAGALVGTPLLVTRSGGRWEVSPCMHVASGSPSACLCPTSRGPTMPAPSPPGRVGPVYHLRQQAQVLAHCPSRRVEQDDLDDKHDHHKGALASCPAGLQVAAAPSWLASQPGWPALARPACFAAGGFKGCRCGLLAAAATGCRPPPRSNGHKPRRFFHFVFVSQNPAVIANLATISGTCYDAPYYEQNWCGAWGWKASE